MKRTKSTYLTLVVLLLPMAANAIPIEFTFTVEDVTVFVGAAAVPDAEVSGVFVYDAVDLQSPFLSFISGEITIAGYVYGVGELGGYNVANSTLIGFGALVNGADTITGGTNDFFVGFDYLTDLPSSLFYTTSNGGFGVFRGDNYTSYSRTAQSVSVPEPGTLALLGLGLAAMGFARRKRKV